MKYGVRLICVLTLVIVCAGAGFAQDAQPELDALVEKWTQALLAEDIDGFMSCYWYDAMRITYFPHSEPQLSEGYEEIREVQQAGNDASDFQTMNLIYDEPVRYFPRHGRPTYVYPNSRFSFMDIFEFEERRGEYRIITQYLLAHPPQ